MKKALLRRATSMLAVIAAGILLAACGDGSDGSGTTEAPAPPAIPPLAEVGPDAEVTARIAGADALRGAGVAGICRTCHTFEEGGRAMVGPNLRGVVGGPVGHDESYGYSAGFLALRAGGADWTYERLDAFLADPGAAIPQTLMAFVGIVDPEERADLIAWLRLQATAPVPVR